MDVGEKRVDFNDIVEEFFLGDVFDLVQAAIIKFLLVFGEMSDCNFSFSFAITVFLVLSFLVEDIEKPDLFLFDFLSFC